MFKIKIFNFLLLSFILFIAINLCLFLFIYFKIDQNYILNTTKYKLFKSEFILKEYPSVIPHPYYGFISDSKEIHLNHEDRLFYKLPSDQQDDDIKILILGGSVATHLSDNNGTENIFQNIINEEFNTKRFKVFNGAMSAAKQPQQYFKLIYLLLKNYNFELVINLDGFNEFALTKFGNYQYNLPLDYPAAYNSIVYAQSQDRDCVFKNNYLSTTVYKLPVIEIFSYYLINKCRNKISNFKNISMKKNMNGYESEKVFTNFINVSNAMSNFLKNKNVSFIHAIQPSHYFKTSKPLSKLEKENFMTLEDAYGKEIDFFYSLLDDNIEEFKNSNFTDLRKIFMNNSETLFRDSCCHLNNEGMEKISKAIIFKNIDLFKKLMMN